MKRIRKNAQPEAFLRWKALANEDWKPSWDNFQKPQKTEVHQALLQEQGSLCCYCGQLIAMDRTVDARESHIEHFVPGEKSTDPRSLDYENFHASCLKQGERGVPLHCGAAKGGWFDSELTVSPLEDHVESRFRYDARGHIHAASGDRGAAETISRLNLDREPLIGLRRNAVEGALFNEQEPLPIEVIQLVLEAAKKRQSDGRLMSFAQAIESVGRTLVPS
ncbi:MAG: TIGR02646 family protein [Fibrobacteres bacterium]|jgi:uncharacterized protein (TIGR02646 family)|nr:TIGR02646 family protein [Fibrobacterota bacterium]